MPRHAHHMLQLLTLMAYLRWRRQELPNWYVVFPQVLTPIQPPCTMTPVTCVDWTRTGPHHDADDEMLCEQQHNSYTMSGLKVMIQPLRTRTGHTCLSM